MALGRSSPDAVNHEELEERDVDTLPAHDLFDVVHVPELAALNVKEAREGASVKTSAFC